MQPLRSMLKPGQEGKVLRLLKGLYGLKQAGRGWYIKMARVFVTKMGFKWSAIDHSAFYWMSSEEHTIVAVATDDMAVTSKRKVDAKQFKSKVKEFWKITDHRPIKWFLSFQIKRDRKSRTILIDQQAYIESIVELTSAKWVMTLMKANAPFSTQQSLLSLNQVECMKGYRILKLLGWYFEQL